MSPRRRAAEKAADRERAADLAKVTGQLGSVEVVAEYPTLPVPAVGEVMPAGWWEIAAPIIEQAGTFEELDDLEGQLEVFISIVKQAWDRFPTCRGRRSPGTGRLPATGTTSCARTWNAPTSPTRSRRRRCCVSYARTPTTSTSSTSAAWSSDAVAAVPGRALTRRGAHGDPRPPSAHGRERTRREGGLVAYTPGEWRSITTVALPG
jgi:hypothetical protein